MNRDDVIRMAREAGGALSSIAEPLDHPWKFSESELEIFAAAAFAAGAAAEREACAYRAGIALLGADRRLANRVDQAIRAMGQA